jgi:DNA repair protein RecO (recombination protein O)
VSDRERVYRTEAIVLKHNDFGEADRLLTVYTPYLGKLRLLAKGVRKLTSRKAGHLESFTRTQLLVARGRNLDIVTQAQMVESYPAMRQDLVRVTHAYYVGELIDSFSEEQAENEPLYRLLCDALRWVCESQNLALAMRFFELQLLSLVGYRPELFRCVGCDAPIEPTSNYFSADEGGAVCPRCSETQRTAKPIPLGALKVLRYMQTHSFAQCMVLDLHAATYVAMEETLNDYLGHLLERQLKSVEFLHLLRHSAQRVDMV